MRKTFFWLCIVLAGYRTALSQDTSNAVTKEDIDEVQSALEGSTSRRRERDDAGDESNC